MITKMKTRRRKKTRKMRRIGRRAFAGLLTGCLPLLGKRNKEREAQAVVAGTVFRETGHALRGAEITVAAPAGGKKGQWKGVSDVRGEFAVRIPVGAGRYTVTVKAEGYRTQEKPVTVAADERAEFSFLMEPK